MKLVGEEEFASLIGLAMPAQRDMSLYYGDRFQCGCGKKHAFGVDNIVVIAKAANGKFVIQCPYDEDMLSLIKAKMMLGMFYQGLELIAAWKNKSK